ncbi:MAG: N-acetylmuramoyl-L-alanine amidase [Brevibacillus sp.]|nr:N-acetylmuramoyl-L-alanine amidase [Brevibacillus sp.]
MIIIQDFIPEGRPNRPGTRITGPRYITVHDTANPNNGADALAHANYLKGDDAASRQVSWHFTVDDIRIVQHLPLDEVGWHAGDGNGPGNSSSIGIEICENADGNRARAEANAAELVAHLLMQFSLGINEVVQHNHWSGKNCPHVLRERPNGWKGFLKAVQSHLQAAGTPIAGAAQATLGQALAWARSRNADQSFLKVAPIYWEIAGEMGIRPEVAYAQSAKETAFGRFGGTVDRSYHNWCGLKTREGGASGDPGAHARFPDDETGVRAHLQHLALYAGLEVQGDIVDPRHFPWLKGTAVTVEALGGRWAPSADYGVSIVRDYLEPLQNTEAPADDLVDKEAAQKVINLLGALWMASADELVQAAAHYAANALRDAAGIPRGEER